MRIFGALIGIAAAGPAAAHDRGLPVGPDEIWHRWSFDLWVVLPLVLLLWLYGRGVLRLWAKAGRGRGISLGRAAAFAGGALALGLALVSPLDALSETLLSAHMIQHGLLTALAPPLLLAGLPGAALPWALPAGLRRSLARSILLRRFGGRLAWTLRPLPAAGLHGAALWLWHAPAVFDAALANRALHVLEHATFLGTGLLFWQSLALASRSAAAAPAGIAAAFETLMHGGFLSVLITFAGHPLYRSYLGRTGSWGLSALEDQQLAGLIMGAPLCLAYLLAGLALAARLLAPTAQTKSP
jgi:putative membrane protein